MNISEIEIQSVFEDNPKNIFLFNLEQIITSTQLKIFGPEEQIVHSLQSFSGIKLSISEIIEVINKDKVDNEDNQV